MRNTTCKAFASFFVGLFIYPWHNVPNNYAEIEEKGIDTFTRENFNSRIQSHSSLSDKLLELRASVRDFDFEFIKLTEEGKIVFQKRRIISDTIQT